MSVHAEAVLNVPTDDGPPLPIRMGIAAEPTPTDGLVVFPKLLDLFDYDDSIWHVTHTATGHYLPIDFPTEEQAVGFADAIGHLADWTDREPALDVPELVRIGRLHDGTPAPHVIEALTRRAMKEN